MKVTPFSVAMLLLGRALDIVRRADADNEENLTERRVYDFFLFGRQWILLPERVRIVDVRSVLRMMTAEEIEKWRASAECQCFKNIFEGMLESAEKDGKKFKPRKLLQVTRDYGSPNVNAYSHGDNLRFQVEVDFITEFDKAVAHFPEGFLADEEPPTYEEALARDRLGGFYPDEDWYQREVDRLIAEGPELYRLSQENLTWAEEPFRVLRKMYGENGKGIEVDDILTEVL